jgi:hypothetical protein
VMYGTEQYLVPFLIPPWFDGIMLFSNFCLAEIGLTLLTIYYFHDGKIWVWFSSANILRTISIDYFAWQNFLNCNQNEKLQRQKK